jgi:magnesium-transporting ATPase (P-type)
MGINGTEVAKSASDMVLTDDNFSTIVEAVTEGRNVFSNIRKLVYFLIVCNISEILIMLIGMLIGISREGWGIPVTPIMLLIVNVLCDGIPGIALAKELSDVRVMNRKPFSRNESFFGAGLMEVIIRQTIVCSLVVLVGYYIGIEVMISGGLSPSHEIGQTMAFLILGWTSILHIFTVRSRRSVFARSVLDNPQLLISAVAMLVFTALIAYVPSLINETDPALGMVKMDVYHWLIAIALSFIPTIVAEYGKFWDNHLLHNEEKNRVQYRMN